MKDKREKAFDLQEFLKQEIVRRGKWVDVRWWVEEYYPAHNSNDYDDIDYPEQIKSRSGYYSSKEEVDEAFENLVPDSGHKLRIRSQACYERLERTWYDQHLQ